MKAFQIKNLFLFEDVTKNIVVNLKRFVVYISVALIITPILRNIKKIITVKGFHFFNY